MRALVARLRTHWQALDDEIAALDRHILSSARTHPGARWLMTIPGIGALIATALVAAIDGGQAFGRGRDLACWLVPRQHATGGKARLLGISKRGNGYLRRLLVHAARSLKRSAKTRDDRRGAWLRGLEARAHANVATVALAAKLARWTWAVLARHPGLSAGRRLSRCGAPRQGRVFCEAADGMATTVARRRPGLTNEPISRGRPGYQAGAAPSAMTARGPNCASPHEAGYIRADVQASRNILAEPGWTIHPFGHHRRRSRRAASRPACTRRISWLRPG